jgi:phage terminase large subunit
MKLIFETNGNEKQKQAARAWLDPAISDIVFGGGKGGGKSYLGANLIFGDAFIYPDTSYFIARKSLNDLRKYTVPSIYEVFQNWGVDNRYYSFNAQDNIFNLYNKSRVLLIDAKPIPSDPLFMRFGSMQFTRGWIEEAGEFESAAKNNLMAAVGRWKNKKYNLAPKLLQTCNPSKNYLYSDYYKKAKDGTLEKWKAFIPSLLDDNKMLSEEYKQNLLRSLTRNQIERLVYGNWEFDDDPASLCDFRDICDIFHNEHIQPLPDKWITADLAMKGRDRFIVIYWEGFVGRIMIDKSKATGKEIEEDLRRVQIDTGTPRSHIIADSDGMGNYLESYLNGIIEFKGNSSASDSIYNNLRSQCYFKLAEKINKHEIRIICQNKEQEESLKDELGVLKIDDINADDKKKKVISKEKMKELLGKSPDIMDNLEMRMFNECKKQGSKILGTNL